MTTIILDDNLMNKIVEIGDYQSPQEAVVAILSEYIQSHQPPKKLFDKLRSDVGMPDEEVDDLFKRDKDLGRSIEL